MNTFRRFFVAILYWTYPRGTWQWDIYCLVIILIIFSTPQDFLESYTRYPMTPDEIRKTLAAFFQHFF
ncbi:MAG TPA: hypothetical protein VLH08_13235 [Acidobacteriota bacterium]|nr:hypothetical protein [Acidobacteriota bacterium]